MNYLEESINNNEVDIQLPVKLVVESVELLNYIKSLYHNELCTNNQRLKILSLLPSNWKTSDIQFHFNASTYMINLVRESTKTKGILCSSGKKKVF